MKVITGTIGHINIQGNNRSDDRSNPNEKIEMMRNKRHECEWEYSKQAEMDWWIDCEINKGLTSKEMIGDTK